LELAGEIVKYIYLVYFIEYKKKTHQGPEPRTQENPGKPKKTQETPRNPGNPGYTRNSGNPGNHRKPKDTQASGSYKKLLLLVYKHQDN
jgi:hypothetical protein